MVLLVRSGTAVVVHLHPRPRYLHLRLSAAHVALRHLRDGRECQAPICASPPLGRRGREIADVGAAEAPISLGDLAQQLRAGPTGIAPEAEDPAAFALEALEVLGPQLLPLPVTEPHEPTPGALGEAQGDADLAVEVGSCPQGPQPHGLPAGDVSLRLETPHCAREGQLDRALKLRHDRPATTAAAKDDASDQLALVAGAADEVRQLDPRCPPVSRTHCCHRLLHHGGSSPRRAKQWPGQVDGRDVVVPTIHGPIGDKAEHTRSRELPEGLLQVLRTHALQRMARCQLEAPAALGQCEAVAELPPKDGEHLRRLHRHELATLVLLDACDEKCSANPVIISSRLPQHGRHAG
mmetsp:Transcript_6120/g.16782  ORF Transcript_6120/g.16782 Transcript_6120/m.16782 type:complete len:351 (+) Transcript_6120:473-1525(+)